MIEKVVVTARGADPMYRIRASGLGVVPNLAAFKLLADEAKRDFPHLDEEKIYVERAEYGCVEVRFYDIRTPLHPAYKHYGWVPAGWGLPE